MPQALTIENAVDTLKRGSNLTIAGDEICATHPLPLFYSRQERSAMLRSRSPA